MGTGQDRNSPEDARGPKSERDGSGAGTDVDQAEFDAMDTTSWSGSAPPVLIEEEETIVSAPIGADAPAESANEPEPEPESESGPEPEPDPEAALAAAEALSSEPTLPPDESEGANDSGAEDVEAAAQEPADIEGASEPEPERTAEDQEPDEEPDQEATMLSAPLGTAVVSAGAAAIAAAPAAADADPALSEEALQSAEAAESAEAQRAVEAAEETQLADSTEEHTPSRSIAPSASLPPMLLERVEPSMGRGERIRLDVRHWHVRLGRAEENEVRLYTASASREHALIEGNEEGKWILTPAEGKRVFVDGDPVSEPFELEVGMNLGLGKDRLRCVIDGLERNETTASTEAFGNAGPGWISTLRERDPVHVGAALFGIFLVAAISLWLLA